MPTSTHLLCHKWQKGPGRDSHPFQMTQIKTQQAPFPLQGPQGRLLKVYIRSQVPKIPKNQKPTNYFPSKKWWMASKKNQKSPNLQLLATKGLFVTNGIKGLTEILTFFKWLQLRPNKSYFGYWVHRISFWKCTPELQSQRYRKTKS